MNLRHLRFFVALAREGHHGRAAAASNVTQSTLSEAVRQLEHELGVALIERNGQRFAGLGGEGDRVLQWAKRILSDQDALTQDLAEMREGLIGDLRLGAIAAAMPVVPIITHPFCLDHPRVTVSILSRSSIEIERELRAGELEARLTYLENEPPQNVRATRLYSERYVASATPTISGGSSPRWWRAGSALPCSTPTRPSGRRRPGR
jgi:DNA-binding transcriptional LysR family regulator